MTHRTAQKWIIVLVAFLPLGTSPLLFASDADQRDPLEPVATYGDARFRFGQSISSLCFSPDGMLLASSSIYWGTALWDAETGQLTRHFPSDHLNPFPVSQSQVTFSPDGKLLVVAADDLIVWEVASGKLLYKIKNAGKHIRDNRLVQFTRDGEHFLAVGIGEVLFIETKTGRIVHRFKMGDSLNRLDGVALSPDGSRAILGTHRLFEEPQEGVPIKAEYAVKTWDLNSGKESLPRPRQDQFGKTLKSIRFSPDGKSVVAVTGKWHFQQKLKLLDPQTMKLQRVLPTTTGIVESHAYTPDGRLLAVGTNNTRNYFIDLFDPAQGKLIRRWQVGDHGSGDGVVLAISPDGKTIASAVNHLPDVTLWDVATGKERSPHKEGGTTAVRRMVILRGGQTLVTQDENERVFRRDLKTGRVTRDKAWTIPDSFESMGMSSEASVLQRSDWSRMIKEPRLKDSDLLADFAKYRRSRLSKARISADGNRVAVLYQETVIIVYDRRSGKRLRQFGDPQKPVRAGGRVSDLELSADGSRVVGYYDRIRLAWNVETGEKLTPPSEGGRYYLGPDGTLVIVWKHAAQLWNVDEGKLTGTLDDSPNWIGALAFSPDGKFMAHGRGSRGWGSNDIALWDLAARKVIRVLRGARGGVTALCFSPDGRKLYASDNATLTVVWDLSND